MSFVIISKELSSSKISHPEGVVIDFSNFDKCIERLSNMTKEPLSIYDITENQEFNHEEIIPINEADVKESISVLNKTRNNIF